MKTWTQMFAAGAALTLVSTSAFAVTDLTLGTSSTGGSWYPATQAMAKIIQEEMPDVRVTVMPGGSISNVKGVSGGQYDFALAHTQDLADGIAGRDAFKQPIKNIRGLMNLWTNYVQIAVRADTEIKTVADLKGHALAPGQRGWGGEAAARLVLRQYGLNYGDLSKVEFTGWQGIVDLFKDRHVDAAVACSTAPVSGFQDMSLAGSGIRILPLSDEAIAKASGDNAGYFKNVMPAGIYKGQDQPIPTLGSTTILFTRDDLPEDIAKGIVKHLIARKSELVSALKAFEELTPEFAPKIPAISLHSGAAAYYKEIGVIK